MAYDLNAEGTNGVTSETTVVALPGFTSEFDISVWNVDATAAPSIDAIHGITSGGAVGVYGGSDSDGGVGVRGQNGSGNGDGVQGFGSGTFSGVAGFGDPANNGTGVFGLGQGPGAPGVRGIGSGGENTVPTSPVGVYGVGGVQGVEGADAGPGVQGVGGSDQATGVLGTSTFGTAVQGISGDAEFARGVAGSTPSGIGGDFQAGGAASPVGITGPIGVRASAVLPSGGNSSYQGMAVLATSTGGTGVQASSTGGTGVQASSTGGTGVQASSTGGSAGIFQNSGEAPALVVTAEGPNAGVFATNGTAGGAPPSDAAVHAVSQGTPPTPDVRVIAGYNQVAMFAEGGIGVGVVATAGPTEAELTESLAQGANGLFGPPDGWNDIGTAIYAPVSYGTAIDASSCFGAAINATIISQADATPTLPQLPSGTSGPLPGICITASNANPQRAIYATTQDTEVQPSDCIDAITYYGAAVRGSSPNGTGISGITESGTGVIGATTSVDGIGVTADGGKDSNGNPLGAVALQVQNGTIAVTSDSAGTTTMTAGKTTVTVNNAAATPESLIFLTPLGNPEAFLWIKARNPGSFTIEASKAPTVTVPIGFLIIN